MTAKVDLKKILIGLAAVAVLVLSLIFLLGGKESAPTAQTAQTVQTSAAAASSNDERIQFLKKFGWEVTTSPKESAQVKIPKEPSEVFDRYNALQKAQGYDLSKYAGKKVMRYVYEISNYPGATEPVYATVLTYKNNIIGGDITDTAAKGKIQGFQMVGTAPTAPSTAPSTPSQPNESTAAY